jgi:hypothetical protein
MGSRTIFYDHAGPHEHFYGKKKTRKTAYLLIILAFKSPYNNCVSVSPYRSNPHLHYTITSLLLQSKSNNDNNPYNLYGTV